MSFFFSDAYAQAAPAAAANGSDALMQFLPLILIFVVFYFILIRPQANRSKEHAKMVETLAKGDEVVTNGGLLGKIIEVGENFVLVEVANEVQVRVQKQAVASLMPKGTLKSL
ncbi:Sec translocon accessory complex subunit YajC [Gammaproteobacteria bacterium]